MFTGLIEGTGRVVTAGETLSLETGLSPELRPGDSLAVDGSCLTVERLTGSTARFRVSPETLRRTVPLTPGVRVNLERPLVFSGRLHGHLVTGHVDCTGTVASVRNQGRFALVEITCPSRWHELLVEKGSAAVNGISLTVADLLPGAGFSVAVIPETLDRTNAGLWKPGYRVNIEFDIVGKYLQRFFQQRSNGLREKLEQF